MKRIFALTLCILMLLPLILVAPTSAADGVTYVGYSSPAICTDAGKTVDLTKVGVQFTDGENPAEPATIVWKDGTNTITSYTPTEKGVYELTATAGGKTRKIYVVAKNANEKNTFFMKTISRPRPILPSSALFSSPRAQNSDTMKPKARSILTPQTTAQTICACFFPPILTPSATRSTPRA